ncbi:PASTA domain-containing protein, partial [Anaerorhabdus sp.]
MTNKKDFLSSLAEELEGEKKGVSNDDFDIYQAANKKGDELRSYKNLDYDFEQAKKTAPKAAPQPTKTVASEPVKRTAPTPTPAPAARKATLRDGKEPDSFQQEKLQKIEKKPFKLDPKLLVAGIIALLLTGAAIWYFVFAPKIPMPNFVGQTINDVGAWAKQNNIPTSNIIVNTEFSTEFDKDVIITQDKTAGSKIKDTTPLTFVASKGANPDDPIDFPDLMNMNYTEVKDWIETNKLSKTKINTQYNTIVEKDKVINFELKTGTESSFTRGSTLTINISKGAAPAGTVAVENFVGKTIAELEQWATSKKIVVEKTEAYSDTVEAGKIISQGIKVGESLEEGGKLPVVVSKGKAVKIPNFVGYTKEMLEVWAATPENKVTIIKKERYNAAAAGNVIEQSIKAGSAVDSGSVLELTISLYMPQLETNSRAWYGKDYLELVKWVDDANGKGANMAAGAWDGEEASDEYPTPGQIISYRCLDVNGNQLPHGANGCARPLPIDAKIAMKISNGPKTPKATPTPTPE